MSLVNLRTVTVPYGTAKQFSCELDVSRILAAPPSPLPNPNFTAELRQALRCPLEYPPLSQAIIPDDRVVLALDRQTPGTAELLAGLWETFEKAGVKPNHVTILQPAPRFGGTALQPESLLPHPDVVWKFHVPGDESECYYLASTVSGDRIYLAKEMLEAEMVISIGEIGFDPMVGYRGTNSVFYPGLSTAKAVAKAQGHGHRELGPENDRPLRQLMDEVGWLLGTQFTVQVVPSLFGGVAHVLAGSPDSVLRRGKELVNQHWLVELDYRADLVVVGVDHDAAGHGWSQIGSALATARNLVSKGGRIVVLSEVEAPLGDGLKMLARSEEPSDCFRALREAVPEDLAPATEIVEAVDWADTYLLSRLKSDVVEDLFMVPLESETEVERLLGLEDQVLFLPSAQHTFGRIRGT